MSDRAWRCIAGHLVEGAVLITERSVGGWCPRCGHHMQASEQYLLVPL